MFVSPQRIRWLFVSKALIVPPTWLAMCIWAFIKVPSSKGFFQQHSSVSGSQLSWAWLSALNAALGFYSTVAVNIPDFTVSSFSGFPHSPKPNLCSDCKRYAKNEKA